jgi:hypothetical protein
MQINIEPGDCNLFAASTLRGIAATANEMLTEVYDNDEVEWPAELYSTLYSTLDLLDALQRAAKEASS